MHCNERFELNRGVDLVEQSWLVVREVGEGNGSFPMGEM